MAGGGETEKDVSAWTVDSTREEIREILALRDRVDLWRDRLHDEREAHRDKVDALTDKMLEQRFQASEQANAQLAASNAEKFAGFPQQYALSGETNAKLAALERAIAELVAASQTRVGQETGVATQRVEVAAQQEQRRLSRGSLLALAAVAFTVLNTLLPWLLSRG